MQYDFFEIGFIHTIFSFLLLALAVAAWPMRNKTPNGKSLMRLLFVSGIVSSILLYAKLFGSAEMMQSLLSAAALAAKAIIVTLSALFVGFTLSIIVRFKRTETSFPINCLLEVVCGAPVAYGIYSLISLPQLTMMLIAISAAFGAARLSFLLNAYYEIFYKIRFGLPI